MNTQHILQTDALDVLFTNRNKSYGAYQLRKNYNKRLFISLLVMMGVCLFSSAIFKWNNLHQTATSTLLVSEVINLTDVGSKQQQPAPLPPVNLKQIQQPQVATVRFTIPKLVNEQIIAPPTQDDLTHLRIDVVSKQGIADNGAVPPMEQSIGSGEGLVKTQSYEGTFTVVEQQASFPGGADAWKKFLERNLRSATPSENGAAIGNYTVYVSFLVDKEGNISNVTAENDPGYGTAAEAVRVIQRGPAWTPAEQNGHKVTYRASQAITFVVANQE